MIHIMGYVILAWKQLSTSTCFKTIVRLMHSTGIKHAPGMNRNKRYGYKLLIHVTDTSDQLFCVQDEDSKVREMIYL